MAVGSMTAQRAHSRFGYPLHAHMPRRIAALLRTAPLSHAHCASRLHHTRGLAAHYGRAHTAPRLAPYRCHARIQHFLQRATRIAHALRPAPTARAAPSPLATPHYIRMLAWDILCTWIIPLHLDLVAFLSLTWTTQPFPSTHLVNSTDIPYSFCLCCLRQPFHTSGIPHPYLPLLTTLSGSHDKHRPYFHLCA